jgi:hypothetical protein
MNNTKTTIAGIFIAATLVVGVTFAATTTHSALAYKKDKRDNGSKDGNTVTIQANKQKGSVSGWDNTLDQEAENVICTHPGNNGTCVTESEGAAVVTPGGGGQCSSPLVSASLFVEGGPIVCVNPALLTNPNAGGNCPGQQTDVFIDSTHKCLGGPPK